MQCVRRIANPSCEVELNMTDDSLENRHDDGASKPPFRLDPLEFQRAIAPYFFAFLAILLILPTLGQTLMPYLQGHVSRTELLELPLYDTEGPISLGWLAMGPLAIGLVSFGGLAVGGIAIGGGAVGIVAIGGGAVGLLAMGGGAFGVIAVGGGAVGYVAVGGGAAGRYALGGGASGRYILTALRQHEEAVRFFCKHLPRLRQAFVPAEDEPPGGVS
jgi:hypothetical protein